MDLSFLHSLKHMAFVKIVISVINTPEMKALFYVERTDGMLILTSFEHQQEITEMLSRILLNIPLPACFIDEIARLIIPIIHEFDCWRAEHIFLTEGSNIDLLYYLQWRSSGTIDYKITAENLVRNQKLDVIKRFLLSCLYCLKDNVVAIWNEMSAVQKESVIQDKQFSVVGHWVKWLKRGTKPSWSRILRKYIATSHAFFDETPLSLSCFSQELTSGEREEYLAFHILNGVVSNEDLLVYMHQLKLNERRNAIVEYAFHILSVLLEWPFQGRFMHIINSLWEFLREEEFLYLFLYLTARKQQMRRDFDYSELAREVWLESPAHFKEFARNALRPYP